MIVAEKETEEKYLKARPDWEAYDVRWNKARSEAVTCHLAQRRLRLAI